MKQDSSEKEVRKLTSAQVAEVAVVLKDVRLEISKAFVGQDKVVDGLICALLCNGHVLLEGVPGIAKTLAIRALSVVCGCSFKRIQFTVDLLPSDIIGLTTYDPQQGFQVLKGPVFANFVIADEVNRSPPKTQSALIEAMQERQVTIGKTTYPLPSPFFVMANQNPLESEGVYSLPEAQVDRFLFKIIITYPEMQHEEKIMEDNITLREFSSFDLHPILSDKKILELQNLTHHVYLDRRIKTYILNIVAKTRTKDFSSGKYIELGCSPRASIALFIASKASALLRGRNFVIPQDVKDVAHNIMRHRLILSYQARAENFSVDKIIDDLLQAVRAPS
ncbi:MAG TPA: MoxR family ATPase [Candidatus Nanoarchaeia archaeon]|nr:MoxR family ATPase [Candidatus Nanoarchaeia archaeon]